MPPPYTQQICPLTGDWKAKLRERYEISQIETEFGGELDLATRVTLPLLQYQPVPYSQTVEPEAQSVVGAQSEEAAAADGAGSHASPHAPGSRGSSRASEVRQHKEVEEGTEKTGKEVGVEQAAGGSGDEMMIEEEEAQRLELITKDLPHVRRATASTAAAVSAKRRVSMSAMSTSSIRTESEDEFLTPVTSPGTEYDSPDPWKCEKEASWPAECGGEGGDVGARPRVAIVTTGVQGRDGVEQGLICGMKKASSEVEMAAHQHQVLHAAHGGVWDAHSSTERGVLMKAAIHSMTEAGLDEEVAQKVFELDKAAVERCLSAAARGGQDGSSRGACLDELHTVADEYGLLLNKSGSNTPLAPATPTSPIVIKSGGSKEEAQKQAHESNEETHDPSRPRTPPPEPLVLALSPSGQVVEKVSMETVMITDDYLREIYRSVWCDYECVLCLTFSSLFVCWPWRVLEVCVSQPATC